jgi:arylsulfatase A-like enzyme
MTEYPMPEPLKRAKKLLFIIADQWRGDTLSHLGHAAAQLPNLARIAARGVTFARHFVQSSPCNPSRAAIYSGQYLMNHRVVGNETPMDPHVTTLPFYLRRLGFDPCVSGYTSTIRHPDGRDPADPILRSPHNADGWRVLRDFDGKREDYLAFLHANGWERTKDYGSLFPKLAHPVSEIPASPIPFSQSDTRWIADAAHDYIRYHAETPWAVHLSLFKPHLPLYPSPEFVAAAPAAERVAAPKALPKGEIDDHPFIQYSRKRISTDYLWRGEKRPIADLSEAEIVTGRRAYYAICAEVDAAIGQILDTLEATGQIDDTIIIFTSDHGECLGDYGLWGKFTCFPEAFHVPLIVADPSPDYDATRGSVVRDFSEGIDVLPTILDLLGTSGDAGIDGRSLKPYLASKEVEQRKERAFFEFDFRNDKPRGTPIDALPRREKSLAATISDDALYIHFPSLPPLSFRITDPTAMTLEPITGHDAVNARLAGMEALLAWRLRHADSRRTGLVATECGMETVKE